MGTLPLSPLFTGEPMQAGGLSNQDALVALCPQEFRRPNEWSVYAALLYQCGGANMGGGEWVSFDEEERRQQHDYLKCLVLFSGLSDADKEAVGGWMLSQMLRTVPEYILCKEE